MSYQGKATLKENWVEDDYASLGNTGEVIGFIFSPSDM